MILNSCSSSYFRVLKNHTMPEPLKNYYNDAFFDLFAVALAKTVPTFNKKKFIAAIYSPEWKHFELKDRMHHICRVLHTILPADFPKAIRTIKQTIKKLRNIDRGEFNFLYMFLPEYVEVYGIENFDESMKAFEFITVFSSAEFAVRPFLIKYPDKMMKQMLVWSKHKEPLVRRLASEGSRPRLPWAMAVPYLKKDPKPILPILENLKNDPSETVRRSVANNLNDIAKDHPDVVLTIAKKWLGKNANAGALVKHACRTLLKQGNKTALHLFDVGGDHDITVSNMNVSRQSIRIGESIDLSFTITNNEKKPVTLRVEYAIDFVKARGVTSRKIFKVTEGSFAPSTKKEFKRKLRFADLTTRIHHAGEHKITLVINGAEKEGVMLDLKPAR